LNKMKEQKIANNIANLETTNLIPDGSVQINAKDRTLAVKEF